MKNKLRFLMKNKQGFIALFILLAMVFNACENPAGSFGGNHAENPSGNPPENNNGDFAPIGFYVDSDGKFTETDSGITVLVADDKAEVVFYSDDIENDQRVGLTFEDKVIIFFFEKDRDFPSRIVLSDSENSYNGIFTPYDTETQTYSLTLEQGGEKRLLSNIALSNDIFTQYKNDPKLDESQNLRMRNLYIATCIYKSLDDFIAPDVTIQDNGHVTVYAASGDGWVKFKKKFFSSPTVTIVLGVTKVIIGGIQLFGGIVSAPESGETTPIIDGALLALEGITDIIDGIKELSAYEPVTGISLDKKYLSLVEGSSETLTATIKPANATNKQVSWISTRLDVATVDGGVVTALKSGFTTIKVVSSVL